MIFHPIQPAFSIIEQNVFKLTNEDLVVNILKQHKNRFKKKL